MGSTHVSLGNKASCYVPSFKETPTRRGKFLGQGYDMNYQKPTWQDLVGAVISPKTTSSCEPETMLEGIFQDHTPLYSALYMLAIAFNHRTERPETVPWAC